MAKPLPLKDRYGYLTVHEKVGRCRRCVCDCGSERLVRPPDLVSGKAISCGCRFAETRYRKPDPDTGYPEYRHWAEIKRRCYIPTCAAYRNYGGRGILMCPEWRHDFRQFLADMGPRPSPKHSIERLDNDGPYSPENCVWADRFRQASNQRRITQHTYRGFTGSVHEICRRFGGDPRHVAQRVRLGWSIQDAMERPLRWSPTSYGRVA